MTEKPTAAFDLPAVKYPFTIERFDRHGFLLDTILVKEPGVVSISAGTEEQKPITIRVIYGDGTIEEG